MSAERKLFERPGFSDGRRLVFAEEGLHGGGRICVFSKGRAGGSAEDALAFCWDARSARLPPIEDGLVPPATSGSWPWSRAGLDGELTGVKEVLFSPKKSRMSVLLSEKRRFSTVLSAAVEMSLRGTGGVFVENSGACCSLRRA